MPIGSQFCYGIIELNTDSSTHADNHSLAIDALCFFFVMIYYIFSKLFDSVWRTHNGFHSGPFGSVFILLKFFLTFCDLFKLIINFCQLFFICFQFNNAVFIINPNRCFIFYRLGHVICINGMTKYGYSRSIFKINRCPCKADKRRIR